MVDFNTWMSIGLNQCGNDRQTFAQLVDGWNSEKDNIEDMTEEQVRDQLVCP